MARGEEDVVRESAQAVDTVEAVEQLARTLGDAPLVLIGEATHGTREFYTMRARLTQALIEERGFSAVAIEGDWPDAYRVNRYVQGLAGPAAEGPLDPEDALAGFERFPAWMWRNTAVAEFVGWLRNHNRGVSDPARRTGFYGLDLYGLHASMRAVVHYLEGVDPSAAAAARRSYACFEHFGEEPDTYGWATGQQGEESCAEAVARELSALRERRAALLTGAEGSEEDFFYAEQNARLARNAEEYYRTMVCGRVASWNLRDGHMAETLDELALHLARRGRAPKIVVWAHNSHVGDARATELAQSGELNLGQLVRERQGSKAKLVGFTTYEGTVTAASDWGAPGEAKRVRRGLIGSWEELFHRTGLPAFALVPERDTPLWTVLAQPRLERAIGVVYRPETERISHYFEAKLAQQFDLVLHFDATGAVEPFEAVAPLPTSEAPEAYPSGF